MADSDVRSHSRSQPCLRSRSREWRCRCAAGHATHVSARRSRLGAAFGAAHAGRAGGDLAPQRLRIGSDGARQRRSSAATGLGSDGARQRWSSAATELGSDGARQRRSSAPTAHRQRQGSAAIRGSGDPVVPVDGGSGRDLPPAARNADRCASSPPFAPPPTGLPPARRLLAGDFSLFFGHHYRSDSVTCMSCIRQVQLDATLLRNEKEKIRLRASARASAL
jgi:hypothetical protein